MPTKYVTYTWMIAQMLHPVVWSVLYSVWLWSDMYETICLIIFSTAFSFPVYLISLFLFNSIRIKTWPVIVKFFIMLLFSIFGIALTMLLISAIDSLGFFFEIISLSVPAMISAALAMIFTLPIFLKQVQSNENYEYSE